MNTENDIQVSVCVVTYNQEKYIAECLESLVTQQTNFKFEIIVGEDCSTDNTRSIVQNYVDKYPNLIVPLFYEKNLGPVDNLKEVYKKAKGKYIAHMDGDDLALPNKLQKQFDVLEKNSDYSVCVHNMLAIDKSGTETLKEFRSFKEGAYGLINLYLITPFFIHSSKMFVNKIGEYINDLDNGALDTEFHIEQAKQGRIYYIESELGKYRQFVGVTFENNFISKNIRDRIEYIYENYHDLCFSKNEIIEIKKKYARLLIEYAYQCAVTVQDKYLFKYYVEKSLTVKKISYIQYIFKIATLFPSLFFILFKLRSRL